MSLSQRVLFGLFAFLCICVFSTNQIEIKKLDGEEIPMPLFDKESRKLYNKGFRFIVNNNCTRFKVEVRYTKQFMKQLKALNCKVGTLNLRNCETQILCKQRYRIVFGILGGIFWTLKRAKCNAIYRLTGCIPFGCGSFINPYYPEPQDDPTMAPPTMEPVTSKPEEPVTEETTRPTHRTKRTRKPTKKPKKKTTKKPTKKPTKKMTTDPDLIATTAEDTAVPTSENRDIRISDDLEETEEPELLEEDYFSKASSPMETDDSTTPMPQDIDTIPTVQITSQDDIFGFKKEEDDEKDKKKKLDDMRKKKKKEDERKKKEMEEKKRKEMEEKKKKEMKIKRQKEEDEKKKKKKKEEDEKKKKDMDKKKKDMEKKKEADK